jgi:hypothetical protein
MTSEVLMIFPDRTLAMRLENTLAQDLLGYVMAFNQLFPDYGASYLKIGGGIAIYTGSQFINSAIGLGFDTPISHANMETLEAYFRENRVDSKIDICPFTDSNFLNLLNERHYHLSHFRTAYIHPLDAILPPPTINPDIIVKPITATENDIWVQTVMDMSPDDHSKNTQLAQAVTHRQDTICFLARIAGEPVGASALSIRDGIATFYFTATRQAYRKCGVQTAMIQTRLAYAKSQGCEIAFSTTIPGNHSMRNVMRAGFRVAYVRCTMVKEL